MGYPATDEFHLTRVDLVWQFRGDPALFVLAHRNCRHQCLRCDPHNWGRRSLEFRGSEVRIIIYDKVRQQLKRNSDIVRVEIQLHGRRLMEELGQGQRVRSLCFGCCYQAYRRILLGFTPKAIPKSLRLAHHLAIGERESWQSDGVSAFDLYTHGMSDRQIRRLKNDMAAYRPSVHKIDWNQLLPIDDPPEPIEIIDT